MLTKNFFPILVVAVLAFSIFGPLFSFANGGDQRVVENKYLINLSRAPFTPRVGTETSFLASFVDLKTSNPVQEDLIVKVRISKLEKDRKFIFEEDLRVKAGVLEFQHAFADPGLHEIFFDFALASNLEKVYEAPDFLLDVQNPLTEQTSPKFSVLLVIGGVVFGFILGWFAERRRVSVAKN